MISTPILPQQQANLPEAFLELLYPLPRPMRRLEELHRYNHNDLPNFTDVELERELGRTWLRIMLSWPPADDWLWKRREAVFAERDRRHRAKRAA